MLKKDLKVALVHDFLIRMGGAERVLNSLRKIFPNAPVYTLLYNHHKAGQIFPKEIVRCSYLQKLPSFIRKRHKFLFPLMPGAIEQLNLDEYDLVISSSSAYAHGVITSSTAKHINYCHSPMRYAWDWYHQYKKDQNAGLFLRAAISFLMKKIREWDKLASDRPDIYIANSRNVQQRIKKYYRRDSQVIYPPVDVNRFKVSPKHEDFFLIVSTLTPYKKIDLAIQLFNKINRRLVIIGDGSDRQRLESIAQANIDFLGFRPDEVVQEYLQSCRALIFPGEEDFGIVPVEAMACGKPVLAYGLGGCLETVKPGLSGEFFYQPDLTSIEDGLARLIHNEHKYQPQKIRQQAEKFSEENFLKTINKVINQALMSLRPRA